MLPAVESLAQDDDFSRGKMACAAKTRYPKRAAVHDGIGVVLADFLRLGSILHLPAFALASDL